MSEQDDWGSLLPTANHATVRLRPRTDPGWLSTWLTALLVIPCAALAVLYILQIDVLVDPRPRRLLAAGAVSLAPVVLFLLRALEALWARPGQLSPNGFWAVWVLVAVTLVAGPVAARLGLGTRPATSGFPRQVRDVQFPRAGEILFALAIALGVTIVFALFGFAAAGWGSRIMAVAAALAVGVGLATVPVTFYGMALSYDVVVGTGDHPLADTAQTLSIVWFVAAPMAGLIAGWTAWWSRRR